MALLPIEMPKPNTWGPSSVPLLPSVQLPHPVHQQVFLALSPKYILNLVTSHCFTATNLVQTPSSQIQTVRYPETDFTPYISDLQQSTLNIATQGSSIPKLQSRHVPSPARNLTMASHCDQVKIHIPVSSV